MAKNLVIVESPAKAKTIEGYLGKDFVVKSSYGHVRDLVKSGMGVNVDKNFDPVYEVSPEKVDDLGAMKLARDIAKRIEEELKYPGEIKVNVFRETRAVEYAR